jgi:hypothetical protein
MANPRPLFEKSLAEGIDEEGGEYWIDDGDPFFRIEGANPAKIVSIGEQDRDPVCQGHQANPVLSKLLIALRNQIDMISGR